MVSPGQTHAGSAEVLPSPGIINRLRLYSREIGTVFALGLSVVTFAQGTERAEAEPVTPLVDINSYPYINEPCLSGDPNDPNSSYGKTDGVGKWCEDLRWGPLDTKRYWSEFRAVKRNCTDWVLFRHHQATGELLHGDKLGSSAKLWNDKQSEEFHISSRPVPGSIGVSEFGEFGHVGYVEDVIEDSSGNVTSIVVSEFNRASDGNGEVNTYDTRDETGKFKRGFTARWDNFLVPIEGTTSSNNTAPTTTTTSPSNPNPPQQPSSSNSNGYWLLSQSGIVYPFGDARNYGNADGNSSPSVDIEDTPSSLGYWVAHENGSIDNFGDARDHGESLALRPGEKVTSLSGTLTGSGYWEFTSQGRVIPHGDATHNGDMDGVQLAGPVLDSVATPSGKGYYMVASDGGVFSFGDAKFYGSMGGKRLNAPVESLVPDPDGKGYWLVASDGGIFAFDAPFRGSMGGKHLNQPISAMVAHGNGYLLIARDGGVFNFSDKPFKGSLGNIRIPSPIIASVSM